ncbi:anhydro-N-acetylmuramic acid kinase [Luteibaculum oceani]|nr:anhydro-N-acetylmuramic acid kinase [Luteibaculum oceani]
MELAEGKWYHAIGVMSGSSMDGLDIALCKFAKIDNKWEYEVLASHPKEFPGNVREALVKSTDLSAKDFFQLDAAFGDWIGHNVKMVVQDLNELPLFAAVHGHTVFHYPQSGYSTQLGDGAHIAAKSGIPAITSFRQLNIAYKGQGAPLVPFGDLHLFPEYDACLNLGGIANISLHAANQLKAWDISPCNQVFNYLAQKMGQAFDRDGVIAISGKVEPDLLTQLNRLEFYQEAIPKSMGNHFIKDQVIPLLEKYDCSVPNKMKTFQKHVEDKIFEALTHSDAKKVLVTGGGAFNTALIKDLQDNELGIAFHIPSKEVVENKEAIIFAFLGLFRWFGLPNILASYSGATKDCSGGTIHLP